MNDARFQTHLPRAHVPGTQGPLADPITGTRIAPSTLPQAPCSDTIQPSDRIDLQPVSPTGSTALQPTPASTDALRAASHATLDTATAVAASASGQPAVALAVRPPSSEMTEKLKSLLPANTFHISAADADRLASELGVSKEQLMVELIPVAKAYARPPISNYLVGAVGLGKSGDLYLGVNLEFNRQALNQTVHGEQFVVANAMAHGETGLQSIAVSAEPCGHCRQFLNELDGGAKLNVLIPDKEPVQLQELLPRSFGPGDLGLEAGLLNLSSKPLELPEEAGSLAREALDAANRSYAPYSKNPSGVALKTADGSVFKGFYAENAAFNPSLSPLQSALVQMVAAGRQYSEIREAALVEARDAQASQIGNTKFLLEQVAPKANLAIHLGK